MQLEMTGQYYYSNSLLSYGSRPQRTMLVYCGAHKPGLASGLVDVGKEFCLLVVVMLMHAVVPGYAVACEVHFVRIGNTWGLLVDTVEAADEGVVAQCHVRGLNSERIGLCKFVRAISCSYFHISSPRLSETAELVPPPAVSLCT